MTLLTSCVAPRATTSGARGYVSDSATKNPVMSASVSIKDFPEVFIKTDKDGFFDLPPKKEWMVIVAPTCRQPFKDSLIIERQGYQTKEIPIVESEREKDLLIYLKPKRS